MFFSALRWSSGGKQQAEGENQNDGEGFRGNQKETRTSTSCKL